MEIEKIIGHAIPKYIIDYVEKNIFGQYPNVIGWSNTWLPRLRYDELVWNRPVVKIYVSTKIPANELKYPEEFIPRMIWIRPWRSLFRKIGFDTDIVEIGFPEKFDDVIGDGEPEDIVDKTQNFRPVELGVSVGNEAITAGSHGMLYEPSDQLVFSDPDVNLNTPIPASNAHVISDDPSKAPEDVSKKNILQRGSYHGGRVPDDVVGEYLWHKQIYGGGPSTCPVATGYAGLGNFFAWLLHKKSRFRTYVDEENSIDFGIYKPTVEHIMKIADNSIDLTIAKFIGHLFAGSDTVGIIARIDEILSQSSDWIKRPLVDYTTAIGVGDRVKGVSFWCNFETTVIDPSATVQVGYGTFNATFVRIVLVSNDGTIKGGWSGSGWYKV